MTVHLVGAGPGDPGLLTVRAAELIGRSRVVLHDRLVSDAILALVPHDAEVVDVGKRPGCHRVPQAEINQMLIDLGGRHDPVVRLKGGDPFVFGRGGEELLALQAAGIPVEVVPGVSAALAAPAAAHIPVTHRGLAQAVTIVTGHEDPLGADRIDWEAHAATGATLVVLMGTGRAASIAERLIGAGRPDTTPVGVISRATTPDEQVTITTLRQLGTLDLPPPATIVIGDVAAVIPRPVLAVASASDR